MTVESLHFYGHYLVGIPAAEKELWWFVVFSNPHCHVSLVPDLLLGEGIGDCFFICSNLVKKDEQKRER